MHCATYFIVVFRYYGRYTFLTLFYIDMHYSTIMFFLLQNVDVFIACLLDELLLN